MKNVNYWTISCNVVNDYNVIDAFKDLNKIDWSQSLNGITPNDIVYIYVGAPYSKIMYKCIVNKINLSTASIESQKYSVNKDEHINRYMEIELLCDLSNIEMLQYKELLKHGLSKIRGPASASEELVKYIESRINSLEDYNESIEYLNKKRVNDKKSWIKVLNNEIQENNIVLDILLYLYDCKNYTSNGKEIAKYFNIEVSSINSYISSFGRRVIDILKIDDQIRNNGQKRKWNIPFETVIELNKNNIFTWKLRKELVEALVEKYDLPPKEYESIDDKILQFIDENPYDIYCSSIENDLKARDYFLKKFTLNNIMTMPIDDFVIGRAELDNTGKDTFCYLIERTMLNLGDMRGAYVRKFGVWYNKKDKKYEYSKKYGETLESAFDNLKKIIVKLIIDANKGDYDKIEQCPIANIFKGKILSTYFPEKYLCIFDEEDVDKFLNALNITYDIHKINTLEKKKELLKKYKSENKLLREYSDYYYVLFLYKTFKNELKIKNTISGQIDYDIEFVDLEYLKNHEIERKSEYRSRNTDYEKINRNKKDVGNRGENAVLRNEINKLKKLGYNDLLEQVRICDNDAIGYDIISFDENKNEIHIEVKTNSSNKSFIDFYITDNELKHLIEDENYYIYYLYNIKGRPKCHVINKDLILKNNKEFFQPVIYKVNIDVIEK